MNVSKRQLKALIERPSDIGTTDRYLQEGMVYLAQHLLANEGKIIFKWGKHANKGDA